MMSGFSPVPNRADRSCSLALRGMQGNYKPSPSWLMNLFLSSPPLLALFVS